MIVYRNETSYRGLYTILFTTIIFLSKFTNHCFILNISRILHLTKNYQVGIFLRIINQVYCYRSYVVNNSPI